MTGRIADKTQLTAITTAQIGRCGELLVQYRLLMHCIESAPLTTDGGIDLVAYPPGGGRAVTIQVKTNLRAKPGGGKGALALDWWAPQQSPADLFALVDLQSDQIWLFWKSELARFAQQKPKGRLHFYMYTDNDVRPRGAGKHIGEFESFKIEARIAEVFGNAGAVRRSVPQAPNTAKSKQYDHSGATLG